MRFIITESQNNNIREKLINAVKSNGWSNTAKLVGGDFALMKIFDIKTPEDFLHFYDGMTMYKDKNYSYNTFLGFSKNQIMIQYNDQDWFQLQVEVDNQIWAVLKRSFGFQYIEIQAMIKEWLKESYNLGDYKPSPIGLQRVPTIYDLYQV